uniref:Uncharacterized protein n=1 Tax=Alexandrium catenella TaxID=2925 RepID=A0A7S1Q0Z1_ALECA
MADKLSRRVESATDQAERKGEVLARRVSALVEKRLRREAASLERQRRGSPHARAAEPTRLFLERPRGFDPAEGRSLLLAALACAGTFSGAVLLKRRWRGVDSVSPPESVLG